MKILAIDCSTDACSVAINFEGDITQKIAIKAREHNKLILPMVDELLRAANLKIAALNAIAFGCGPGSFTGTRLAASITQGFAIAYNLPVIPVSSLLALAQGAYRKFKAHNVLSCLDARMQEIYLGAYHISKNRWEIVLPESVWNGALNTVFDNQEKNWIGVGDAWPIYKNALLQQFKAIDITVHENCYPEAYDIAVLAAHEFQQNNLQPAEKALPVYLRETSYRKITY